MTRLLAFGCSNTYGHCLPDCCIEGKFPGDQPSKLAWPSLLAEKLGLDCINLSKPGLSNFGILDSILKFNYSNDDLVIVMWSLFNRDMLFDLEGRPNHAWNLGNRYSTYKFLSKNPMDHWEQVHNPIDSRIRSWYHIHHAHSYLSLHKVKFFFMHVNNEKEFLESKPNFCKIEFLKTLFLNYSDIQPKALDNIHNGINAHRIFADDLYSELIEKGIMS